MVDHTNFGDGALHTEVASPRKENEGSKDAYVSYLVTTKTTFKSFQTPETSIRRRYTDFVFLYQTLSTEYPAIAVPPLPEKHNLTHVRGNGFSSEFTTRRMHSLHRFLKRISLHPELRRSSILLQFLESDSWNSVMRSRPGRISNASDGGNGASGGVFESFTDTFLNAFTKVHKPDKRFMEVREKAEKLDEELGSVEKVVTRVARRQADLESDFSDLASQFQKLVQLEPGQAAALTSFASSAETTAQNLKVLKEHTELDYLTSLKDMGNYTSAVKALLKAREQKQLDFEGLSDYLAKAATDRDQLASQHGSSGQGASGFLRSKIEDVRGVDHEQARRSRLRKLEMGIERLTREVERSKIDSESFDDRTVHEVGEFERIKGVELQDTLGGLAEAHIRFFQGTVETWEGFLKDMEREGGGVGTSASQETVTAAAS